MTAKATRLYPLPPREIRAEGIYEDLELPPTRLGDSPGSPRPYVIINMVASLDGRVAVGGKSSLIGSEVDRRTMRNLRSKADAVMIGAGTLRSERLSLGLDDSSRGQQPLAVVATGTGDVPLQSNLILGEGQEVLLLSPAGFSVTGGFSRCRDERMRRLGTSECEGPAGEVDLGEALQILKGERAVELLLVEGGPSLNHSLFSRGLADELFLTLAPKLMGGATDETVTVLDGPPLAPGVGSVSLLSAHLFGGELYLRYRLR